MRFFVAPLLKEIILVVFEIIVEASFAVGISMYISQYIKENRIYSANQ